MPGIGFVQYNIWDLVVVICKTGCFQRQKWFPTVNNSVHSKAGFFYHSKQFQNLDLSNKTDLGFLKLVGKEKQVLLAFIYFRV